MKIVISLHKAKPEWFSLSDIHQVIFNDVKWTAWNLHQMKTKMYEVIYCDIKSAYKNMYSKVYRNGLHFL